MDRRRFLRTAAAGAVGFGTLTLTACTPPTPRQQALARPHLMDVIGSPEEVRVIGEAYRTRFPEEDGRDALTAALDAAVGPEAADADLAERLRERVRQDFEEDRTVIVNGWVLARTEARQCALYSLLNT